MTKPSLDWRDAEFVERIVLPCLCALALGVVGTLLATERREAEATAALEQARKATALAQANTQRWAEACTPLMSWPIEAAPELIPGPDRDPAVTLALRTDAQP